MQLLEKRRRFFAAKRVEEKRIKPPTQAQQRKIMSTYLKNMEGKKLNDLKNKSFDSIQKMFDRAFKRVNTFVDQRTELVKGSSKRAGEELTQESAKKQKMDDDKEIAELNQLMEIIPEEEEVAVDAIPLAVKFFAAKRVEEKRIKPPTQAQQRKIMSTYLKNMEGKKLNDLKNKSFDSIQKMFDRAFKRVNTFVDQRTELVKGSSKRAGEELTQESAKKQKMDDDKEIAELNQLMEIIPEEEEVAVDAIPLAVKSPKIFD
nr:hypothetical protein [Tanacetum cinerariifolium]